MDDRPVLIIGKDGQVGGHLARLLPEAVVWGRAQLDLTNSAAIGPAIETIAPRFIVNAAAYTQVDQAEAEPELAMQINGTAVEAIARAAEQVGAGLIHYSTDYVFDGTKQGAYLPHDVLAPINAYGRSKAHGESAVRKICARHWVLRTSWVFSEQPPNFVATMLRLAGERDEISVVNDQIGTPTYAGDLADLACRIISGELRPAVGIHHAAAPEVVSWHEFALAIFETAQACDPSFKPPVVHTIDTADYPTPAPRPANSALGGGSGLGVRSWRDGLELCVAELLGRG